MKTRKKSNTRQKFTLKRLEIYPGLKDDGPDQAGPFRPLMEPLRLPFFILFSPRSQILRLVGASVAAIT